MQKIFVPAKSVDDWRDLLANKEKHWKDGYSAKELAFCWQNAMSESGFPICIENVLKNDDTEDTKVLFAFPEYRVPVKAKGHFPQNDLFVIARYKGDLLSMMVEGKANEPFDSKVENWLDKNDKKTGREERLNYLLEKLNLLPNCSNNNFEKVRPIRYQLIQRAASAVIMAQQLKAEHALMCVQSFSKSGQDHFGDFEKFARLFEVDSKDIKKNQVITINKKAEQDINLHLAWISCEKPC
ncbi:MAG: hypothetical protein AB2L14_13075 [Candidatus Xenobiia bacterium LiM19]